MSDRFSLQELVDYAKHEAIMNIAANIAGDSKDHYYERVVSYHGRRVRETPGEILTAALAILNQPLIVNA